MQESQTIIYHLLAIVGRAALVIALVGAGWLVYKELPNDSAGNAATGSGQTTVEIVLRPSSEIEAAALDIPIEISPVDLVLVKQEYQAEPHTGKRFEEFRNERMKGRTLITTRLNKQGQASVTIPPGDWWVHAIQSGNEDLEWRLHIKITGYKQTVELTPQNAYTRSKSF
jgi:hypothetical protein